MKRAFTFTLLAWIVYRVGLQLFGQFALSQSWMSVYPGFPIELDNFGMWARFDSSRYLEIVSEGYYPGNFGPAGSFPGYPIVAKLFTFLLTPLQAGLAASSVSLFFALLVVYQMSLLDCEEPGAARRTLLLLLAFPSAFLFSAVYSESLFLLLCASSYLAVRKGWEKTACVLAALATLTRLVGVCLLPALAWEMWTRRKEWRANFLWLLLPGFSVLAFFFYLQSSTGNFYAYLDIHKAYAQALNLWTPLSHNRPLMLEQKTGLAFFIFEMILLVAFWTKLRPSYRWFVVCSAAIAFYSTQGLCSQRFMLVQFPLFLVAGQQWKGRWFALAFTISVFLQLWLFTLWVYGYRATY